MKILMIFFVFSLSLFSQEAIFELITPIPQKLDYDLEKAKLGKKLYMDTNLSKDKTVSCNSCHSIDNYGVDNLEFSLGVGGQLDTPFNTPSSFNAVFNFVQFWNGRAKDLVEQAKAPFVNPKEMGLTESEVVSIVKANPQYVESFKRLYGEVSFDTIASAIAEFEKTLITPNSPFDRYLKGDVGAISEAAQRGFQVFKKNGCISCHQGQNIGGNMYQRVGVFADYPNAQTLGRYEITGKEEDKMVFKVPSLRNIAKTAPYFHDGSIPTLENAVQLMADYQLGRKLSSQDLADIIAFLNTLTGEVPNAID